VQFTIPEDAGLIGLLDPATYRAFVHTYWMLPQLFARFEQEMAARHLLLWGTGGRGNFKITVELGATGRGGFREVAGPIHCSAGKLCLVGYDALTNAAQFDDVLLDRAETGALPIALESGAYRARIVQLYDPATVDAAETWNAAEHFLLELEPLKAELAAWRREEWFSRS
jgi:hypothetical protein